MKATLAGFALNTVVAIALFACVLAVVGPFDSGAAQGAYLFSRAVMSVIAALGVIHIGYALLLEGRKEVPRYWVMLLCAACVALPGFHFLEGADGSDASWRTTVEVVGLAGAVAVFGVPGFVLWKRMAKSELKRRAEQGG